MQKNTVVILRTNYRGPTTAANVEESSVLIRRLREGDVPIAETDVVDLLQQTADDLYFTTVLAEDLTDAAIFRHRCRSSRKIKRGY